MLAQFFASQSVELAVPDQSIPIQHYMRQPQRLIKALVDPNRTEQLTADSFRLKMQPVSFIMLSVQPIVDMQVWAELDGTIHLKSIGCEIRGVEYINQRFSLNLNGRLAPQQINGVTYLVGRADLEVQVDVPPLLWLTPKSFLESTGNALLHSVLSTVRYRLMHQLLVDYRSWAIAQLNQAPDAAVSPHWSASASFLPQVD